MSRAFEVRREVELPAPAEKVWDAVATGEGTAGWLWPITAEERGTPAVWDPPHRLVVRTEGPDGWFNQLEFSIEGRGESAVLRYVHSGIFTEDWDGQYEGVNKHTDFYLSTLGAYLRHFPGQHAAYVSVDAPASTADAAAIGVLRKALGLGAEPALGDQVRLDLPGLPATGATVDYSNAYFLGLRTDTALVRVFARGPFGAPLSVSVHQFGDADPEAVRGAWQAYLDGLYG